MVFSSIPFIAYFLPAVFLVCAALRRHVKWQNAWLTSASLFFYAYGDAFKVLLLLMCALVSFYCAKKISQTDDEKRRRLWLFIAMVFDLGLLVFFKYTGFLAQTLNSLFGLHLSVPHFALPIGISFFTFQAVSFVFDVKRNKTQAPKDFMTLILYLSLFPQLIAGPIVRWDTVREQFEKREMNLQKTVNGLCRFIIGLSKKALLADTLAQVADAAFGLNPSELGPLAAWLGAVCYTLQIYLDFSGYSDMALGLGKMFGFSFPENFNRPLNALGMRAFWRRWHMTLTDWFTQYVYIPLGGNRRGKGRARLNIMLVFLLTGLWHGADWSFVLWGAFNGVLVLLEHTALLRIERWPKWLACGYTLAMVVLGFVIFRAENLLEGMAYLSRMFSFSPESPRFFLMLSPLNILAFSIAIPVALMPRRRLNPFLCALLLVLALMSITASGYHPFIYFRF